MCLSALHRYMKVLLDIQKLCQSEEVKVELRFDTSFTHTSLVGAKCRLKSDADMKNVKNKRSLAYHLKNNEELIFS